MFRLWRHLWRRYSGGSALDHLHGAWNKYTVLKVGIAVGSAALAMDAADLTWKAFSCDLPTLEQPKHRDIVVKVIKDRMDKMRRCFMVVSGLPGIGKTSAVLEAARLRGTGVVYVDAELESNFDKINEKLLKKYGSGFFSLLRHKPASGWEAVVSAAGWYSAMSRAIFRADRKLVVIVDHVDKLEPKETLKLLGFAKTAADRRGLTVWLVGSDSDGFYALRQTSAYKTRGVDLQVPMPNAAEMRDLIHEALRDTPDLLVHAEEVLYLVGRNPAFAWSAIEALQLLSTVSTATVSGNILNQFKQDMWLKMKNINVQKPSFWLELLDAGPHGVPEASASTDVVTDNNCLLCKGERLYFRNGLCRDFYAHKLQKAKVLKHRRYEDYAEEDGSIWAR